MRPSSQSGKTITHKQAVYRQKYPNCHTRSLWRCYLSVLWISCTTYLLLYRTIENTETHRKRFTWIPTEHIFSPYQFFTKCLSSRVTFTSNTTLSHPPEKPTTFSPPSNRKLRRKCNWIKSLWLSWGPWAWNERHSKGGKNSIQNPSKETPPWKTWSKCYRIDIRGRGGIIKNGEQYATVPMQYTLQ